MTRSTNYTDTEIEIEDYATLIDNMHDLAWSIDREYRLIASNRTFDEMFRTTYGHHIHRGNSVLAMGFGAPQLKRYKRFFDRALGGETFMELEHTETPVTFWGEISFYPIKEGGIVVGVACYSHDITLKKKAEAQHTRMTADILQRNKDLEQFSYIVSHNLRSLVANIIGLTEVMRLPNATGQRDEDLMSYLSASVLKLDTVIKDLNYILQIDHGQSNKKELAAFSAILADIEFSIDGIMKDEKVKIVSDFSAIDEMHTVKSYLYSIFYNLVTNSIKYRRVDLCPTIRIKSFKRDNNICMSFKDNGMGIDLAKRGDQVFGLYKRFHDHVDGKGLGLYMVKKQVESLGGKITIVSEVNKGTEFMIEFEIKDSNKQQ